MASAAVSGALGSPGSMPDGVVLLCQALENLWPLGSLAPYSTRELENQSVTTAWGHPVLKPLLLAVLFFGVCFLSCQGL